MGVLELGADAPVTEEDIEAGWLAARASEDDAEGGRECGSARASMMRVVVG